MPPTNPSDSRSAIELQRIGPRVHTGESLSDPEVTVSDLHFSQDFPHIRFLRSVKVSPVLQLMSSKIYLLKTQLPRYLKDKISGLPNVTDKHRRRLEQYHLMLALSPDSKSVLNRHVWVSGPDGFTSKYSFTNTIAQNLDVFQQGLSNHQDRKLILCAINAGAHDDFDIFVPSYQRNPVQFLHLLRIIFSDRWPDWDKEIEKYTRQMRARPVSKLEWKPQLPSRTAIAQPPSTEPSLCDLDISLQWVHEHPKVEQDWTLYISEPHARRPTVDTLRLVALKAQGPDHYRLLLFATSGEALERYKQAHDDAVHAGTIDQPMGTEVQALELLLVSVAFIISEVSRYIAETVEATQQLVS
jgi:hypothetical protein